MLYISEKHLPVCEKCSEKMNPVVFEKNFYFKGHGGSARGQILHFKCPNCGYKKNADELGLNRYF